MTHAAEERRAALVTGATGGIGRAIVATLASAGWTVFATGRDPVRLRETAGLAASTGGEVRPIAADLRRSEDRAHLVREVTSRCEALHLLVNNAAIASLAPVSEVDDDDLEDHFAVNVEAPVRLVRDLLPHLRRAGRANIVNVASEQALRPTARNGVYGASKAALVFLTRSWAAALAEDGVRVNCLLPGAVDTAMLARVATPSDVSIPLGRLLRPEDVAAWVPRLLEAEMVTGAAITVDGGTSL